MILTIGSPKGGAGKTTTAGHLLIGLSRLGSSVGFDCDPEQSQLVKWSERSSAWPLDRAQVLHMAVRDLQSRAAPILPNYEHAIFDMGAKNPLMLRKAMALSDIVVIPTKGTDGDLTEIQNAFEIAAEVDAGRPDRPLQAIVLLTQIRTNTDEESEAREFLAEVGLPVMTPRIPLYRKFGRMREAPSDLGEYDDVLTDLLKMYDGVTA